MADIINKIPEISYITCINSLGNGLVIEDELVVIKPKEGLGGIGGLYCLPIGLSNVNQFYKLLKTAKIVGVWGNK